MIYIIASKRSKRRTSKKSKSRTKRRRLQRGRGQLFSSETETGTGTKRKSSFELYREEQEKNAVKEECPICYEQKELCPMKPCNHKICRECYSKLRELTCPLCRRPIRGALIC